MAYLNKTFAAICLLLCLSLSIVATAQTGNIVHTIKKGETLSALATKYATTVSNIMRLNGMNPKSQLIIGQAIKIPTGTKPITTSIIEKPKKQVITQIVPTVLKPETSVTITDITYVVTKGQSLYSIAKKFNTTDAQLKTWNNLPDNKINVGQLLIVGKEPIEKSTIPVITKPEVFTPIVDKPAVTVKPVPQPEELTVLNAGSAKVTRKEPTPVITQKEVIKPEPAPIPTSNKFVETEGYFAGYFNRKEKNANTTTGSAAVFKTTSGWSDKKYYVLINDITQGSIVRVTANNKSICAKVLGSLPDIKEDNGLLLRLSNSAAAMLGIEDMKFDVVVNY
ncbi:MAG: LysM peptidoglycan-binding domain-containing protein [Deinococcales bacterium]|nr:LysM peptidoglycan-binding domain-containing protein [Chitinophagaceae bacterium]